MSLHFTATTRMLLAGLMLAPPHPLPGLITA
jgi:hypothetical protein